MIPLIPMWIKMPRIHCPKCNVLHYDQIKITYYDDPVGCEQGKWYYICKRCGTKFYPKQTKFWIKMPSFVKYYSLNRKNIKYTPLFKKRERERSEK